MLSLIASTISILAAAVTEGEGLKAIGAGLGYGLAAIGARRYWNSRRRSDRRNDQTARVCGNGKNNNVLGNSVHRSPRANRFRCVYLIAPVNHIITKVQIK